jgi:LysM repeat protein
MLLAAAVTLLAARALAADPSTSLGTGNQFYRVLAAKPNATFEDAVRAFYELSAQAPPSGAFDQLARALADRKIIREEWISSPQDKLTRGRVAYMLCRSCSIRGGVTMTVFGPSERYAFRECVYLGVWPGGNQRDYVTGGELMGVLKWAADYVEERQKKKPQTAAGEQKPLEEPKKEEQKPPAEEKKGTNPAPTKVEESAKPPEVQDGPSAKSPTGSGEKAPEPAEAKPRETPAPPVRLHVGNGTTYVVQPGDTLAGISEKFYGSPRQWPLILKANNMEPGRMLTIGQTLAIPPLPQDAAEERK